MRLNKLIITAFLTILWMGICHSQDSGLTLNLNNVSMQAFVQITERDSKYRFIYKTKDLDSSFLVSVNIKNGSIEDILHVVFRDSKMEYNIVGNEIYLVLKNEVNVDDAISQNQRNNKDLQVIISGQVLDGNGIGLLGATILEKGARNGTTTDENGYFEFRVLDENPILVISYIGFHTQEIKVEIGKPIEITLLPDSAILNEVIVVGYGTQRKADMTGAVGSISQAQIDSRPITSPDEVLAGAIAGLNISTWSGDAGSPINVRIRGTGTVGSNTPLWVIDGIPIVQTTNLIVNTSSSSQSNPLAGINPNDIESIDVLKDASSAAIYGARAANGVIIVTTKRGEKGNPTFSYNGYGALVKASNRRNVLNVPQYIELQRELGRDFSNFSNLPFVDWQDAVNKESFSQNHNLSVSGGSGSANYFISGSYLNQEGVEVSQGFERYTLRANADISVGNVFSFGQSLLLSHYDRDIQSQNFAFASYNAALNAPFFPIFQENSPLFGFAQESDSNLKGVTGRATGLNLIARADPRVETLNVAANKVLGNFYGEIKFTDNLRFKSSIGIDYTSGGGARNVTSAPIMGNDLDQDLSVQSLLSELTLTSAGTLHYSNVFGNHSLSALIGYEQTKFRFDKLRLQGTELTVPNFPASGGTVTAANEADLWTIQGWLGRINYNYLGKYLVTANIRRDATSRFGAGFRSGIFPSLSAGWRISEEEFFTKGNFLNKLKLRVSWGQNGNQEIEDSFSFLSQLNTNIFYVVGDNQRAVNGPAPVQFSNPALTWEIISQFDLGLDITMFDEKLDFTFDYYNKKSKDVLLGVPLPLVSGFFLPSLANIGSIRNTGLEISFDYENRIGDFSYNIGANLTTVKNTVSDLGTISQITSGVGGQETHRTVVGESLAHFYGFKTNGLYQNVEEINSALPDAFSAGPQPGDIRFVDINQDGVINADDRTNIGNPIPGYFYGINLGLNYRNWDFSSVLRGVGNVQIYNRARRNLESYTGTPNATDGSNNFSTTVLNRWRSEGSTNSANRPRLVLGDPNGNERYSDRWIEDGDYFRIQNIQLGYAVNPDLLKYWTNNTLSKMRIHLGINNLATFSKYDGPDPDVTRARSFQKGDFTLATGQDGGITPEPTVIQLGASITF